MKTKHIRRVLAALVLLVCFAASAGAEVLYVQNPDALDRLNLRKDTSGGDVVAKFFNGTAVDAQGKKGEFTKVEIGRISGYMKTSFLTSEKTALPEDMIWLTVSLEKDNQTTHLRGQARKNGSSLDTYGNGTTVLKLGEEGDYYHVRAYDKDGYMAKENLVADGSNDRPIYTTLTAGRVTKDKTPLRPFPSKDAPAMAELPENTGVEILGMAGVYYYVSVFDTAVGAVERQQGFIPAHLLYVGNHSEVTGRVETTYAIVTTEKENGRLALRSQADGGEVIGLYANGTQVEPISDTTASGWWQVRIGNQVGYMDSASLMLVDKSPSVTW